MNTIEPLLPVKKLRLAAEWFEFKVLIRRVKAKGVNNVSESNCSSKKIAFKPTQSQRSFSHVKLVADVDSESIGFDLLNV